MNVLLSAYVAQNLGDDLFIRILCSRYSTCKFYMMCDPRYSSSFIDIGNLYLLENENKIKNIDLQIIIGGSIFMQSYNKSIVDKLDADMRRRYSTSIPIYIIGANFGPYWSYDFPISYSEFFKNIDFTVFRDIQSYELFKLSNMSWAPDVLFNYQLPKMQSSRKIAISCIKKNNRSGLRDYDEDNYFDKISKIIECCVKKNKEIMLCSFCIKEEDDIAAKKIYSMLSQKAKIHTEIINYMGDIKAFLHKFLSAELIIGTRFHSIILGLNAGIPTIPIVYNSKTSNALQSYGFNEKLIEIQEISKYCVSSIIANQLNKTNNVNIDNLRHLSNKHFEILDKLIKENHYD